MKAPGRAVAWKTGMAGTTPLRGAVERVVAMGYGLTYDAIVRRFPPYQAMLDEVAGYVRRASASGARLKVLDVSCGTGTVAARLARDGHSVVALDAVEHLVAVARRRYGSAPNLTFHHLDVARDAVPGAGSFDALVSMHTLYWHPDPVSVLEACRRALKPGGHGVFLTYARQARVARTFREVRGQQGLAAATRALQWLLPTAAFETFLPFELQYLSRDEFEPILARAGFQVLEVRATFLAELSLLAWARARDVAGAPAQKA